MTIHVLEKNTQNDNTCTRKTHKKKSQKDYKCTRKNTHKRTI